MPAGTLVTVPSPVPSFVTSSTGLVVNVAVTDLGPSIVSEHVLPVPVHAPPHPAKSASPRGVAVSVTPVLGSKISVQSAPQLMPAGELVTAPWPSPSTVTDKTFGPCSTISHTSDSTAEPHAK